jgi:hypothetical protein
VRILLAGMLAGDPRQGGATWAVLQYARGLAALGHDVVTVEPVPELRPDVVAYFTALGLPDAVLLERETGRTVGALDREALLAHDAEVLINLSGLLRDAELASRVPVRLFVDLDPVFNQIWHAQGADMGFDAHTHHATVGLELAAGRSHVRTDRRWIPTLPPVVLDEWPVATSTEHDAFTTVGHWRSYGSVEWDGRFYGQRAHAVRRLLDLPRLTGQRLRPALAIHRDETKDLEALRAHGWSWLDPEVETASPDTYRRFVSGSKGEIGLAKAGYVDARSGWFSDRSACYLAAGRPAVVEDTGLAGHLPVGEGLLVYGTAEEAAKALDAVAADVERHRLAARDLAEEHLDAGKVLTRLLEAVL